MANEQDTPTNVVKTRKMALIEATGSAVAKLAGMIVNEAGDGYNHAAIEELRMILNEISPPMK